MPPRDLKGPTRKAVANPFEESVRQKAYKGAGGYVSNRGPNRAQFQTAQPVDDATDIVEGLLSFAGVAGDAIGKKLDKKISEDRIIQTQQAVLGLNPTSEATNAGYEAHMAVGVKNEQIKAQTKLNELAQGNYTDEEWQQVIRDVYSEGDKNLANRYPDYNSRTEVQKLMALGMAEMMPQVTAEREAAKMGQEIEGRIQTETDIIISSLKAGQDPTFLLQQSEKRMSAMKFTQSQKEGILKTVAEQTGLSGAIEMTKGFKGDRDTTLYERDGSLIELDKGQQRDEAALKAGTNERLKNSVLDAFHAGDLTESSFRRTVDTHNKTHENNPSAQISVAAVSKAIKDRNEALQDQFVLDAQLRAVSTGRTLYDATPKDRKELLTTAYHRALAKTGQDMAGQPPEAVQQKVAQVTAEYGDLAIKQGVQIPALVMDTKRMLSVNLDADLKSGELLENLPENAERALFQLQSLSPKGLEFHLKAVDDTERKQVLHMMDLMDSGTDPVLALREAQAWNDKYRPVKVTDLDKAEENLASGLGATWYNPFTWDENMPNTQIPYFRSVIRKKLASMPDPTSERAQEQLASWFENEWTVGNNGTLIQVNRDDLARVGAGLEIGNIDEGLEALAFANKDKILPALVSYGYEEDDLDNLIYDVNGQQGNVTFRTPEGDILLRSQSLKGLGDVLFEHNKAMDKKLAEERKLAAEKSKDQDVPSVKVIKNIMGQGEETDEPLSVGIIKGLMGR